MRPILRAALVVGVTVSLALGSTMSLAGEGSSGTTSAADRSRAAELKKRGDEHLDSRRYVDALAAYDASYALVSDPALLYNRGRALQFLARYPEALEAIDRFAAQASPELLARVALLPKLQAELRARVTTVTIRCTVDGARVLVNDRQLGVTPFTEPVKLNAGRLVVDVFADGYFPFHRDLAAPGGGTVELDLELVSRETSGFVTVRSHRTGTLVTIDAKAVGVAPVEAGLLAGTHRIVASKQGHDDAATQIVLKAGENKVVWLDPLESPALFTRWWFWTAVGVAAAATVSTVVILNTEKSPTGGDYSPGLVRF